MSDWIAIANVDDLPADGGIECVADGRIVALFRVGDEFFAVDGMCPHAAGPLAQGQLDGTVVTCPKHGLQVDVCSGEYRLGEPSHHTTWPVKVENEQVWILI